MSNPSKAKGTKWETELLGPLRSLFGPQVDRSSLSGINDYGDFINVPFLIEAKSTVKPLFQQWARTCEKKAGLAWAIIWKGDRRATTGTGPYVLMPLAMLQWVMGDTEGLSESEINDALRDCREQLQALGGKL